MLTKLFLHIYNVLTVSEMFNRKIKNYLGLHFLFVVFLLYILYKFRKKPSKKDYYGNDDYYY